MNMTAEEIGLAIKEIAAAVEGAFPHKIFQTGREEWALEFRREGAKRWLLFSISARNGRIHLLPCAPAQSLPLEGFARNLKKTILRGRATAIRQIGGDRVIHLLLGGGGGEMTLAVEIMGTAGNVYLLDHEGKVGALAHSGKGRIELGGVYSAPQAPGQKGQPKERAPLELTPAEEFPINYALCRRHEESAMEEKLQDAKHIICQPLREELKKLERHLRNLEEELVSLKGFRECRKLADLIKANYHAIQKGADRAEVADLFSPDMEKIVIPLDPAKNAEKNAEAYYRKYRKFEKGSPRIEEELILIRERRERLTGRLEEVNSAKILEELAHLLPKEEESPGGKSSRNAPARSPKEKREQQKQSGPKRFVSSEGLMILVGRNDAENDELTFRIANGRDLWLHARDYPGSHVLVRMPKGVEPPRKTLQEAAMIALQYSKAAKAGKGEVTYCLAKEVKKPKGAPPGKVLVHGAKSVAARIDEKAIKEMKERGLE